VSLSLRDELRVVLTPEQVLLVRIGRAITRRGLTRRCCRNCRPCAAANGAVPWGGRSDAGDGIGGIGEGYGHCDSHPVQSLHALCLVPGAVH